MISTLVLGTIWCESRLPLTGGERNIHNRYFLGHSSRYVMEEYKMWQIVVVTTSMKPSVDCLSRLEIDLTARSSKGISFVW